MMISFMLDHMITPMNLMNPETRGLINQDLVQRGVEAIKAADRKVTKAQGNLIVIPLMFYKKAKIQRKVFQTLLESQESSQKKIGLKLEIIPFKFQFLAKAQLVFSKIKVSCKNYPKKRINQEYQDRFYLKRKLSYQRPGIGGKHKRQSVAN